MRQFRRRLGQIRSRKSFIQALRLICLLSLIKMYIKHFRNLQVDRLLNILLAPLTHYTQTNLNLVLPKYIGGYHAFGRHDDLLFEAKFTENALFGHEDGAQLA